MKPDQLCVTSACGVARVCLLSTYETQPALCDFCVWGGTRVLAIHCFCWGHFYLLKCFLLKLSCLPEPACQDDPGLHSSPSIRHGRSRQLTEDSFCLMSNSYWLAPRPTRMTDSGSKAWSEVAAMTQAIPVKCLQPTPLRPARHAVDTQPRAPALCHHEEKDPCTGQERTCRHTHNQIPDFTMTEGALCVLEAAGSGF